MLGLQLDEFSNLEKPNAKLAEEIIEYKNASGNKEIVEESCLQHIKTKRC